MKTLLLFIFSALAILLAWGLWRDHQRLEAATYQAAIYQAVKDSALAEASRLDALADSALAVADSLAGETARLEAEAYRRSRAQQRRADSLTASVDTLLTDARIDEAIREQVAAAITGLRDSYEIQLADRDRIIDGLHAENDALRSQIEISDQSAASLRQALEAAEEEIAVWEAEAHPSLLTRVRRSLGTIGVTAASTAVLVLVLAGD